MQKAKLIGIEGSQAVLLPEEFRFDGDEICINRKGTVVILFDPNDRYHRLTSALEKFPDDFMADGRDQG